MDQSIHSQSRITMMRTKFFTGLLLSIALLECCAKERVVVCARHQYRNGAWSKAEKLATTAASGKELNRASGTVHYNAASEYLVVMEDADDATIIEMALPRLAVGTIEGTDQRGIRWQLAMPPRCPL